jgi:hypothetical protein
MSPKKAKKLVEARRCPKSYALWEKMKVLKCIYKGEHVKDISLMM